MQIKIQIDGFEKEEEMVLTDEDLDNPNFVDILIGANSYTVPVDELWIAVTAFKNRQQYNIGVTE